MSGFIDFNKVAPEVTRPFFDMGKLLAKSDLDPKLRTLVEIRASQINGCAFCLALHHREALSAGESVDRIMGLSAWREASWYSDKERLALEWAEALTNVGQGHPSAELDACMREHFSETEIVYLTLSIIAINSWNRLNVACHTPPEHAQAVFEMIHPRLAHA